MNYLLSHIYCPKYYKEIMLATLKNPHNSYVLSSSMKKTVFTFKSWINFFKITAISSFAGNKAVLSCCEHLLCYSDPSSNKHSVRIFRSSALQKNFIDFLLASGIKSGFSRLYIIQKNWNWKCIKYILPFTMHISPFLLSNESVLCSSWHNLCIYIAE